VLGAGENAYIAYEPNDMQEAKRLFFNREIYGIVYIPNGYERNIIGGSGVVVPIYLDASYMLMYRQVFQNAVESIATINAAVEFQFLLAKGAQTPQAKTIVEPVKYASHTLFNPYLGYGSFVMPPVIILILQQTLLIGICMIAAPSGRGDYISKGTFSAQYSAKRCVISASTPFYRFIC
jgi:ABC-2 type transport system permease protein